MTKDLWEVCPRDLNTIAIVLNPWVQNFTRGMSLSWSQLVILSSLSFQRKSRTITCEYRPSPKVIPKPPPGTRWFIPQLRTVWSGASVLFSLRCVWWKKFPRHKSPLPTTRRLRKKTPRGPTNVNNCDGLASAASSQTEVPRSVWVKSSLVHVNRQIWVFFVLLNVRDALFKVF